jgi:hypothetical protein
LARIAAGLHGALLLWIYGRLAAKAWLRFPLDWDFLAYHLPGALETYGLTSYTPEPRLVAVIDGFPPLPRALAGLLVLVSGRLSAAGALNVVAFAGLLAGLVWLHGRGISLRWLATALLGVPLFVHHIASGYVDLFAGAWLALALAALSELEPGARRRPAAVAALLVASLAAAMLSKLQAWPVAGVIGAGAVWRLLALERSGVLSRRRALALAAALVLALGLWPVRNWAVFGNPVYPVEFPFAPKLFPNAVMEADSGVYNLPRWLAPHSRPVRFAASILEWNRWYSGDRYVWSLDQGARANPADSPHHRMGGWFPWTIAWLAFGTALARRRRKVSRTALATFAAAFVLVAFVPQSHELRYWLFVPLALALWTARALAERSKAGADRALRVALVAGAALVLRLTHPFAIDARPPAAFAPREARAFWASPEAHADGEPTAICNVNPKGIFWAGPTFREFRVRAGYCDGE